MGGGKKLVTYEALIVIFTFGILLVSLIALIVTIVIAILNSKKK